MWSGKLNFYFRKTKFLKEEKFLGFLSLWKDVSFVPIFFIFCHFVCSKFNFLLEERHNFIHCSNYRSFNVYKSYYLLTDMNFKWKWFIDFFIQQKGKKKVIIFNRFGISGLTDWTFKSYFSKLMDLMMCENKVVIMY